SVHQNYPGAQALEPGFQRIKLPADVPVIPGPFSVAEDFEYLAADAKCTQPPDTHLPLECSLGPADAAHTIAVVGTTESGQWLPALQAIAQQSKWRIINFAYTDCAFEYGQGGSDADRCRKFNQDVVEEVRRLHADAVFTKATVFNDDGTEVLP